MVQGAHQRLQHADDPRSGEVSANEPDQPEPWPSTPDRHPILCTFGRHRRCSAAACAATGSYPPSPALRVRSRETTEGSQPILRAISRTEHPSARPCLIAARSVIVNTRRNTPSNPYQRCCYDPMTLLHSGAAQMLQPGGYRHPADERRRAHIAGEGLRKTPRTGQVSTTVAAGTRACLAS